MALRIDPIEPKRNWKGLVPDVANAAKKGLPIAGGQLTSIPELASTLFQLHKKWMERSPKNPGQMAWAVWVESVLLFMQRILMDPVHARSTELPTWVELRERLEPLLELMKRLAIAGDVEFEPIAIHNVGASQLYLGIMELQPEVGTFNLTEAVRKLAPSSPFTGELDTETKQRLVEIFEQAFNDAFFADEDRRKTIINYFDAPSAQVLEIRSQWRKIASKFAKRQKEVRVDLSQPRQMFRHWLDGDKPVLLIGGGANSNKFHLACSLCAPFGENRTFIVANASLKDKVDCPNDDVLDELSIRMTKERFQREVSGLCDGFSGDWVPGQAAILLMVGPLDRYVDGPDGFISRLKSVCRDPALEMGGSSVRFIVMGRPQSIALAKERLGNLAAGPIIAGPDPLEGAVDLLAHLTERAREEFVKDEDLESIFQGFQEPGVSLLQALSLVRSPSDEHIEEVAQLLKVIDPPPEEFDVAKALQHSCDRLPITTVDSVGYRLEPTSIREKLAVETVIELLGRNVEEGEASLAEAEFWLSRCESFRIGSLADRLSSLGIEKLEHLHSRTSALLRKMIERNESYRSADFRNATKAERFLFAARNAICTALAACDGTPETVSGTADARWLSRAIHRARALPDVQEDRDPALFLTWLDMQNCDLSGLDLYGANFSFSKGEGADFQNSRLENARFENSHLAGADFRGTRSRGVDFSRAGSLDGATFDREDGREDRS